MIQIDTTGRIILNGQQTGLAVGQHIAGSTIYRPECLITGKKFKEIKMPQTRYTLSTEAGRAEFERDVLSAMAEA
jgi:hypothetical protein